MEATSLPRGRALLLPRRLLAALDDDRLVDQLRRGNAAAFEVIYDRHHRGILAYCRHLLGSREEAEDAVQHTFVAAHDGIVAGDREIKLKAWLYTIARNRCLSLLRARREYATELDDIETAGLADEVQNRADLRDLLADVRELPEPQRAALVLSEVADLAHAEIAQVLGCDVAKVKSLVFQARSGLIERRQARDTSCEEIREQLATLRGGSLRRGPLRRHLKACPGCAAYRDEVKRQRQLLAIALPVIPTVGLKESALAAVGLSGAGAAGSAGVAAVAGGGAAGGALAGGGATGSSGLGAAMGALAAKGAAAKIAVAVVATTAAVGGGTVAVTQQSDPAPHSGADPAQRQSEQAPGTGEAPSGGPPAIAPGADDRGEDRRAQPGDTRARERRRARRRRGIDEQTGEHRGERGRDNARTRGRGRQRGLEGAPPPGGRAERQERGERRREARRAPRAEPRTRSRRRRPTPPPRLQAPRPERAPQPAPGRPPEPAPESAPEPVPVPQPQTDTGTRFPGARLRG